MSATRTGAADGRYTRRREAPAELEGLRLALFTDTFAPQLNGVTRTLSRLVDALSTRGAAVQVVTVATSDDRSHTPEDSVGSCEVVRWPSVPFWGYNELRLAAPRAAAAAALLRRFRPSLVHLTTPFGVGIAGRQAARALGIPLVGSYHTHFSAYAGSYGLGALAAPGWRFLRWFHNGGQRTFVPTAAIGRELASRGFRDLAVWGRGVDGVRFHPCHRCDSMRASWGARSTDVVVAYIGRLAPEKGLDLALGALRLVQQRFDATVGRTIADAKPEAPRLRFVFVGDGPHAASCRAHAPDDAVFTGMLHGQALSAAYASADLFIFPSQTDTFGNVLIEAMASGLAIAAVDAPPTRELLGDGTRGVIAPPSIDALADAVTRLAASHAARAHFAERGRTFAATQTWERIFDRLFIDYAGVIAAHRPPHLPPPSGGAPAPPGWDASALQPR